eukprot:10298176-Lingulodinium_polyedra.AAC.1
MDRNRVGFCEAAPKAHWSSATETAPALYSAVTSSSRQIDGASGGSHGNSGCSMSTVAPARTPSHAKSSAALSSPLAAATSALSWADSALRPHGWALLRTGLGPPGLNRALDQVLQGGPARMATTWPDL